MLSLDVMAVSVMLHRASDDLLVSRKERPQRTSSSGRPDSRRVPLSSVAAVSFPSVCVSWSKNATQTESIENYIDAAWMPCAASERQNALSSIVKVSSMFIDELQSGRCKERLIQVD